MPFSQRALAECLSLHLCDLGPGGKNSNSFFCVLFCLIYPGCTHYLASLGNGNELCGSPGVSQCDLQYVSVSLIKSRPWFSSWDFCEPSSPLWALWCERRPVSDIRSQVAAVDLIICFSDAPQKFNRVPISYVASVCISSVHLQLCQPSKERSGVSFSRHMRKALMKSI